MIDRVVIDYRIHKFNSAKDIKEKLDYFRQVSSNGIHKLNEKQIEDLKAEFIRFQNVIFSFYSDTYPTKLFRVTNNKSLSGGKKVKLQEVSNLIGPPTDKANIGRCNLKGESVFYSALDFKTAIWETRPKEGDYITVSEWEIKPGEKIYTHYIFHPSLTSINNESSKAYTAYLESKRQINPELVEIFDELILFLTEEYMKKVDDDKKEDYLFSAVYSSRLLHGKPDSNGFKIDAVCYPSVRVDYGLSNLAILNKNIFDKLKLNNITVYDVGETNYDTSDLLRHDLIKVSPMIIKTDKFDFKNNKIEYDLKAELKLAIKLHEKYNNIS